MLFTQSGGCASRRHCKTCRDVVGGRAWRTSLQAVYELPGEDVNFACPFGLPWGVEDGDPVRAEAIRARKAARLPVCRPCPQFLAEHADGFVACRVGKRCCGNRIDVGVVDTGEGKCIEGRW